MSKGYLIQNGQVFDGSGSPAVQEDVRVSGKQIVEIGPSLPPRGETIIDASGLIVCPGLIDLHAHVFTGMGLFSVDPDQAGLRTGVTTILDTGTAGALTYQTFHRLVMPNAAEDIFALLHISRIGALQNHTIPPYSADLTDIRYVHVPSALECVKKYRDRIIGTKVRLTAPVADNRIENERAGLSGAIEVAEKTGVFCMVHHVCSQIPLEELFSVLRPGDVYTHMYHPNSDNAFSHFVGKPSDVTRRARDRGIIFDVGHGSGSFAWAVAEPACQQFGFWPDTISTDIHQYNLHGPVFDMPTTMSKFLCLGMPLTQVIRVSTSAPAAAMRMGDRYGRLLPGRQADITMLKLEDGRFELTDVRNEVRTSRQRLTAAGVLKRGEPFAIRRPELQLA
jgi:dihydroorotase